MIPTKIPTRIMKENDKPPLNILDACKIVHNHLKIFIKGNEDGSVSKHTQVPLP